MRFFREFSVRLCRNYFRSPAGGPSIGSFDLLGWFIPREDGSKPNRDWANRLYKGLAPADACNALIERVPSEVRGKRADTELLEELIEANTLAFLRCTDASRAGRGTVLRTWPVGVAPRSQLERDAAAALKNFRRPGPRRGVWHDLKLSYLTDDPDARAALEAAALADGWQGSTAPLWRALDRVAALADAHGAEGALERVVECMEDAICLCMLASFLKEEGGYHLFAADQRRRTVVAHAAPQANGHAITAGIRLEPITFPKGGGAPQPVLGADPLPYVRLDSGSPYALEVASAGSGRLAGIRFGRDDTWVYEEGWLPVLFDEECLMVSNRQAQVMRDGDRWLVQDGGPLGGGSTNGTLVIRAEANETVYLKGGLPEELFDGDCICLSPIPRDGRRVPPCDGTVRCFRASIVRG